MTVYVTIGHTESGDDLIPIIWGYDRPTQDSVVEKYRELYPTEYEEVGCVYWSIQEAVVM